MDIMSELKIYKDSNSTTYTATIYANAADAGANYLYTDKGYVALGEPSHPNATPMRVDKGGKTYAVLSSNPPNNPLIGTYSGVFNEFVWPTPDEFGFVDWISDNGLIEIMGVSEGGTSPWSYSLTYYGDWSNIQIGTQITVTAHNSAVFIYRGDGEFDSDYMHVNKGIFVTNHTSADVTIS